MILTIHAGTGKTGTTSIQSYLKNSTELLKENKIIYSGMYFENFEGTDDDHYQRFSSDFYVNENSFIQTVVELLRRLNDVCKRDSIERVVWVNESLYEKPKLMEEIISRCRDFIEKTELILYARRQDRWFKSAYQQWGIKHKVYGGVVRSFKDWLPLMREKVNYKLLVSKWNNFIDKENITFVVYEKCEQGVVQDFFERIGVELDFSGREKRSNESLGYYSLILFKLYNSLFEGGKLPDDMSRFISRLGIDDLSVPDIDANLDLPSAFDLTEILKCYDNEDLDQFVNSSSNVVFDSDKIPEYEKKSLNRDSLFAVMLYAIVQMEKRITLLERKVDK